jgi:hypothetical protein
MAAQRCHSCQGGPVKDVPFLACAVTGCARFYHKEKSCLSFALGDSRAQKDVLVNALLDGAPLICGQHACQGVKCPFASIPGPVLPCARCPTAFHEACLPPSTLRLDASSILCPRHPHSANPAPDRAGAPSPLQATSNELAAAGKRKMESAAGGGKTKTKAKRRRGSLSSSSSSDDDDDDDDTSLFLPAAVPDLGPCRPRTAAAAAPSSSSSSSSSSAATHAHPRRAVGGGGPIQAIDLADASEASAGVAAALASAIANEAPGSKRARAAAAAAAAAAKEAAEAASSVAYPDIFPEGYREKRRVEDGLQAARLAQAAALNGDGGGAGMGGHFAPWHGGGGPPVDPAAAGPQAPPGITMLADGTLALPDGTFVRPDGTWVSASGALLMASAPPAGPPPPSLPPPPASFPPPSFAHAPAASSSFLPLPHATAAAQAPSVAPPLLGGGGLSGPVDPATVRALHPRFRCRVCGDRKADADALLAHVGTHKRAGVAGGLDALRAFHFASAEALRAESAGLGAVMVVEEEVEAATTTMDGDGRTAGVVTRRAWYVRSEEWARGDAAAAAAGGAEAVQEAAATTG